MQHSLFSQQELVNLPGGDSLVFFREWLPYPSAAELMEFLEGEVTWDQPQIRIAGKTHLTPRLQAWFGVSGAGFRYSGTYFEPLPFTSRLLALKQEVAAICEADFNSVLVNLYRDAHDSVGWHADDEVEFGDKPKIASLSLGATRRFCMKPKPNYMANADWVKGQRALSFALNDGDLLLMSENVQRNWLHSVPKESKSTAARINLTFRKVINRS